MTSSKWRRYVAVVAALGALAFAGFRGFESYLFREELGRAVRELKRGDYAAATPRLAALARRWPGVDQVEFQLGQCERAQGHFAAALAAWSRVSASSPLAADAALERGRLALERGLFTQAEHALSAALTVPEPGARLFEVRRLLVHLLVQEGRFDDGLALLERQWHDLAADRPAEAIEILRTHIAIDLDTAPLSGLRAVLDRAEALAPDDARVRLARANLATREGRIDDARRELDACLNVGPVDRAVAMARLRWALAAHRADEAEEAVVALGVDGLGAAGRIALSAWRAARRGDRRAEREAWEQLVAADPAQTAALDRLATLALADGDRGRADELRRRKAAVDGAMNRYRAETAGGKLFDSPRELGRLAEALGRRFESRAFLTIAARRAPADGGAQRALAALEDDPPSAPPALPLALAWLVRDDLASVESAPSGTAARRPPGALTRFTDGAGESGLSFVFESGETTHHQLPETMAGGVGLIDFDGDGLLDVYAVQGGRFPPDPQVGTPGDRLFRNRGDGTFEDVTGRSGIGGTSGGGYGLGVAVGDYDNDGHPDLFLTRWREYRLLHNRGDGTFEDATARAGLSGDRDWPTSAAFADLDNDGDLDLYVCHYVAWDAEHPRLCRSPLKAGYTTCDPKSLAPAPDHVFRNDGGRFTDVTGEAGMTERDGRGLGVVAADLDGDGTTDLFVANDGSANFLWRNRGGFRFEDVGLASGASCNAAGGYQAGMGVACGDLDGDGLIDLVVTNFYGESMTFYKNLGHGNFTDLTAAVGLAAATRPRLGFGVAMLDADNDGWLDLLVANGHVNDFRPHAPYAMPAQLLLGGPRGRLTDASDGAGDPFRREHLGRGLASGDLDNDGKPDALLVALDEPLMLLQNRTPAVGRFLTVALEGTRSNRDAVGAVVTVTAGGRRHGATRFGGGSYLSAGDPRVHFGLGASPTADSVEVRWPSGRVDTYSKLAADRGYLLREGDPVARPLEAFDKRVSAHDNSRADRSHRRPSHATQGDSPGSRPGLITGQHVDRRESDSGRGYVLSNRFSAIIFQIGRSDGE